jgi:hypothetical protein
MIAQTDGRVLGHGAGSLGGEAYQDLRPCATNGGGSTEYGR